MTDEIVQPAGFSSIEQVKQTAMAEGWVGVMVDLWDEGGVHRDGMIGVLLVKVQCWWTEENDGWLQTLHGTMYLGQRDGT